MTARGVLILALIALGLRALAGLWRPVGFVFDPLLIVAVLAGLTGRTGFAMASAVFAGALSDAWSSAWFGPSAFAYLVIAYVLAWLARRIDLNETLPALIAMFAASFASWGLKVGLAELFDHRTGTLPATSMWFASGALNTVFGAIAAHVVRRRSRDGRL